MAPPSRTASTAQGRTAAAPPVIITWSAPRPPEVPRASPTASTGRDRKSTRLNSSHSQISYAVFCLKKIRPRADLQPLGQGPGPVDPSSLGPRPQDGHHFQFPTPPPVVTHGQRTPARVAAGQ